MTLMTLFITVCYRGIIKVHERNLCCELRFSKRIYLCRFAENCKKKSVYLCLKIDFLILQNFLIRNTK